MRRAVNEDFVATLSLAGLSRAQVNSPWVSQCTILLVFPEFRSIALGFTVSPLLVFPVFRSIALEFTVSPLLVFPEFGSIALGSWDHEEEVEMVNIKKRTRR